MKNGEFPEGKYTLRAKIDLASGNFNMRDPVLYRIRYIEHHRQGTKWCIFPMYDFAHPIQDALEGITHSLCSLEYENHRPLYDWVVDHCKVPSKPRQIEFARLGINYTVMSKRKLRAAGGGGPRVRLGRSPDAHPLRPAPPGLYPQVHPQLLRAHRRLQGRPPRWTGPFWSHCLREDLNETAQRVMAVLRPVKLTITNYPEGQRETVYRGEQPRRSRGREPERAPSPATSGSRPTTSWRPPSPSTSACPPAARSAA